LITNTLSSVLPYCPVVYSNIIGILLDDKVGLRLTECIEVLLLEFTEWLVVVDFITQKKSKNKITQLKV